MNLNFGIKNLHDTKNGMHIGNKLKVVTQHNRLIFTTINSSISAKQESFSMIREMQIL